MTSTPPRKAAPALLAPFFIGAALVSGTVAADAAPKLVSKTKIEQTHHAKLSKDVMWSVKFFTDRGLDRFLLLDKKSGLMAAIDQGRVSFVVPAVSGKIKGDDPEPNSSTPAGIWPLTIPEGQKDIDAAMLFVDGDQYGWDYSLLIHRAAAVREQFLKAGVDGVLKRRSSGCIVLKNAPEGYDRVAEFIQAAPEQSFTTIDGDPSVRGRFLVVLPELTSAQQFFVGTSTPRPDHPSPKP